LGGREKEKVSCFDATRKQQALMPKSKDEEEMEEMTFLDEKDKVACRRLENGATMAWTRSLG
jgi:hypothetical protein